MKYIISPISLLVIFFISFSSNSVGQDHAYRQPVTISYKASSTAHFTIPDPVGFVNDFENLFTASEIKTLDSSIIAIHNKTSVQIAIITIDSTMVNKNQIDDFTKETFKSWGLQVDGHFNGILIGLSNRYKKLHIENGNGVEQVLTDYEILAIIETAFMPYLKNDKYYQGTISGLAAIINKLKVK